MLGALAFALTAFNAGIGFDAQRGIILLRLTHLRMLLVQQIEGGGDGQTHRAAIGAVVAGSAGNPMLRLINGPHVTDEDMLSGIERRKVGHI